MMALPGRCAGPSRLVLERPRVCRSLLGGESCAQVATQISSIFQVARRTGAAAMPARHACADALASSAAPGSGARQTARRRCGRRIAKASKGLPVPARRRSPKPGPTTARRCVDHALRQARRRCQRGTHVPMRWRAAPRRDRAHGRPRDADADEGSRRPARDCRCPRADGRPSPGRRRPVDASITRCGRRGGDASEARMCRCAASSAAPV